MSKDLKSILTKLVAVVVEEAEKNPEFKGKLEEALGIGTAPVLDDKVKEEILRKYRKDNGTSLESELKRKKTTSAECKKKAEALGISLKGMKKKDDYVDAILTWCREQAGTASEPEGIPASPAAAQRPEEAKEKKEEGGTEEKPAKKPVKELNLNRSYREEGPEALKTILEQYEVDELKKLIQLQGLDTPRKTAKWKEKERLVEFILTRTESRATQGDVFRNYTK